MLYSMYLFIDSEFICLLMCLTVCVSVSNAYVHILWTDKLIDRKQGRQIVG